MSGFQFCSSCNQYGCHTPSCVHGIASDYIAETMKLRTENKKLNESIQEMAKELHQAINEPMYAGTRKDWIWRAQAAEAEATRLRADVVRLTNKLIAERNEVIRLKAEVEELEGLLE